MNNYVKEEDIIKKVLKNSNNDWNNDNDVKLILKYLDPYIQDGFDVLVDDGYLLYLSDVRREMTNYVYSCMNQNDFLKLAISNVFEDDARKESISKKITKLLKDEYEGCAPEPIRPLKEYIQYSNCEKVKKEFESCYHEYVRAINELKDLAMKTLDTISSSIEYSSSTEQLSAIIIFINKLEQLKNKDFYKSLTYDSRINPKDLFYQEVYLSEDAKRIFDETKEQIMHFQFPETKGFANYTLDDIYAAIPKDVISYELLENEEIYPGHIDYNSPFVNKFYHLAKLLVKDADNDDNFENTVYAFLIEKVSNFQKEFFDYYDTDDFDDVDEFTYSKHYWRGKNIN